MTSGQTRTSSTISNFRKRDRRTVFVGGDTLAGPLGAGDVSGGFGIVEFGVCTHVPNSTKTGCKRRTAPHVRAQCRWVGSPCTLPQGPPPTAVAFSIVEPSKRNRGL